MKTLGKIIAVSASVCGRMRPQATGRPAIHHAAANYSIVFHVQQNDNIASGPTDIMMTDWDVRSNKSGSIHLRDKQLCYLHSNCYHENKEVPSCVLFYLTKVFITYLLKFLNTLFFYER